MTAKTEDNASMTGFYGWIERVGNKIPHPVFLFIGLWFLAMICSYIFGQIGVSAMHPGTKKMIAVVNLVTAQNIGLMLQDAGKTWMTFAPMITVPLCTLGLAVAMRGGMLESTLRLAGTTKNVWALTLGVAFIGVNANLVGDAAFIVFPPLVAMLFVSVKRNALAGLFLGYGSVSVGFGACLLVGSGDAFLAGFTEAAAKTIDPNFLGNAAMSWYYLSVSTFVVTLVCAWVCIKVIEPRLAKSGLGANHLGIDIDTSKLELAPLERKGLRNALISLLGFFVVVGLMCIDGMPFAAPEGKSVVHGLLFRSVPTLILVMFFLPGYAYGKTVGKIKKFGDTIPMMQEELKTISGFFLICFFASQFIAIFGKSNMATIIAIHGGQFLVNLGLPRALMMGAFVIVICFINLFMGSAGGKWGLISMMFVPMFMIAGINPATVQGAYRMGDGLTNNITPTLPYLAILLGYAQEYEPRARLGTVMAYQLPYTLYAGAIWILFLIGWLSLDLPMGPGYSAFL